TRSAARSAASRLRGLLRTTGIASLPSVFSSNLASILDGLIRDIDSISRSNRTDDSYFERLFVSELDHAVQGYFMRTMPRVVSDLAAHIGYSPDPRTLMRARASRRRLISISRKQ